MSERGATFADLLYVDEQLVRAGIHPLTPFWRSELKRFYESDARQFVGRVGRGGAKSHTSAKVALTETLFGNWHVPPGERHFWAFVSKNKDEAAQRLLLLQSFLRALKVRFDVEGDMITLADEPRGFRVFACQVGACASSDGTRSTVAPEPAELSGSVKQAAGAKNAKTDEAKAAEKKASILAGMLDGGLSFLGID